MSGDGKDAGQEMADKVHPPWPPFEPKTEELDREDDRGTEVHGHGSLEKVPQACSTNLRKERRGSLVQSESMVKSSHKQDRPPTSDAHGHAAWIMEQPCSFGEEVPLRNKWFK